VPKYVYCRNFEAVVEYEKSLLESDGRTGLEIVCVNCHYVICTFHDTKGSEDSAAEPDKISCPKCGMPLPCIAESDSVDALRCPNCDALFERGQFVCYGAKPTSHPN
jgi:hypothetical protein